MERTDRLAGMSVGQSPNSKWVSWLRSWCLFDVAIGFDMFGVCLMWRLGLTCFEILNLSR